MAVKLIDSHCHLDNEQFTEDREAAIERDKITGALTAEQMAEAKQRIAAFTPQPVG